MLAFKGPLEPLNSTRSGLSVAIFCKTGTQLLSYNTDADVAEMRESSLTSVGVHYGPKIKAGRWILAQLGLMVSSCSS